MHDGLVSRVSRTEEIHFQYVPMMTAQTPASLSLLDRIEAVARTYPAAPCCQPGQRGYGTRGILHGTRSLSLRSLVSAFSPTSSLLAGGRRPASPPGSHHPEFRDVLCKPVSAVYSADGLKRPVETWEFNLQHFIHCDKEKNYSEDSKEMFLNSSVDVTTGWTRHTHAPIDKESSTCAFHMSHPTSGHAPKRRKKACHHA